MLLKGSVKWLKHFWGKNSSYEASFSNKTKICDFSIFTMSQRATFFLNMSYSDRLHDFFVTIDIWYQDINSFFPHTARLWNSLPIECFSLTYNLSDFKSRIDRNKFSVCFNVFVLLFLVTPCLVVAVHPCVEWIPILKKWYF